MHPPGRASRCQEGGEVSGSGPRIPMLFLTGTFQTVKHDPKLNGESHEYANSVGGHQLPDDATE